MSIMLDEILSQKDVLKNTFNINKKEIKKIVKIIKQSKLTHIEIVARGSSRNACELFKYELESNSNYRVSFVYPSTITKYNGTLNKQTIYIGVSQGGKGEDLRIVMTEANKAGALTIAITNEENSPLNKVCKHNLYLKVNKENSMAATKTFTSEMLVLQLLYLGLTNKDLNIYKDVNKLIDKIDQKKIRNFAHKIKDMKNLFVLTRGKLLGIGKEICCKLQETCFINANCFASSDFMHGPFALVDSNFNSLILLPNDATKKDVLELVTKINKNNGHTFVITSDKKIKLKNKLLIPNVKNELYPFIMTFVIQLLSANISKLLKRDPDKSRNLDKYTKTI